MIGTHRDWASLIDTLRAARPEIFGSMPYSVTSAVLAGPCAIATWLYERGGSLAQNARVSILLIGAEATDAPDEGRWYQMLPLLLGRPFSVEVTCVGLELDARFSSSASNRAPDRPARAYRGSLSAFLDERRDVPADIAFAFHPGLQKHRGWLEREGFPRLIERGIPLVCAAYERDEYEMERWIVEAYGYRASAMPLPNPFFLDLSGDRTSIRWASVLWQIERAPAAGAVADRDRLAALDRLNRMVMHSLALGQTPAAAAGATVELTSSDGQRLTLIHVFDQRFVDPASGEVMLLEDGTMKHVTRLPPDVLSGYPGHDAREIDCALWAASAKERFLMGTYPAVPASQRELAAGMLERLRRRASALFRGPP